MHPRERREGLPRPHARWAPHRHGSNPIPRREGPSEQSAHGRDADVPRPGGGGGGDGPVRRKPWVLAGAAVLTAVTATGVVVAMSNAKTATPAAQAPPANTVKVERGKLSAMVSLYGTLTYRARSDGSPYAAINQARGTYTKLPDDGDKVDCGDVFYRVDDHPVVLLCGTVPAYRVLHSGDVGNDVRQLNANLHTLGYDAGVGIAPDDSHFTWKTQKA